MPAPRGCLFLDCDVCEGVHPAVQSPLTQKSLSSDPSFQVPHQTLLLGSFNTTDVFYIYLCNALINVCLPSCPEPSRRSGITSDFVFYSHCTP